MSDDDHIVHQLWWEESSPFRWPLDTLRHQSERWRQAWNEGQDPAPLRYCSDIGTAPEPESVVDPRELRHGMHKVRRAPYVAPAEPAKPVLAEPTDREPWPAHLLVALFTKRVSDLRGKSLSEIASKKVPNRITENEIAMALNRTKPNRKSIEKMTTILMSETATAAEVARWKLRDEKMKDAGTDYELPADSIIAESLHAQRHQLAA